MDGIGLIGAPKYLKLQKIFKGSLGVFLWGPYLMLKYVILDEKMEDSFLWRSACIPWRVCQTLHICSVDPNLMARFPVRLRLELGSKAQPRCLGGRPRYSRCQPKCSEDWPRYSKARPRCSRGWPSCSKAWSRQALKLDWELSLAQTCLLVIWPTSLKALFLYKPLSTGLQAQGYISMCKWHS